MTIPGMGESQCSWKVTPSRVTTNYQEMGVGDSLLGFLGWGISESYSTLSPGSLRWETSPAVGYSGTLLTNAP